MFGFGLWEGAILLVLLAALFGLKNLPQILGEAGRLFGLWQRVKSELRSLWRWF